VEIRLILCADGFVVPVKRTIWTQKEKEVVLEAFRKQLQTNTLITGKEMQNLISSTPCLAKRTVPQMRVWLHTQKKIKYFLKLL